MLEDRLAMWHERRLTGSVRRSKPFPFLHTLSSWVTFFFSASAIRPQMLSSTPVMTRLQRGMHPPTCIA